MTPRLRDRLRTALDSFFRRRRADRELDEELAFHFEQMAAHQAARGVGSTEALQQARRAFGGFDQVKEACRDMRTLRPLEQFLADLRFGMRLLRRSPVFTLVAVLSLALGLGATTTLFSALNTIVLRSLPVERPGELYVANASPESSAGRFSWPAFADIRETVGTRATLAAATPTRGMQIALELGNGKTSDAEPGRVQLVSGEYFPLLRQRPQAGRLIGPEDNRVADQQAVAVISDGYWTRRFGRAADTLGRVITLNGTAFTIIGIAQRGFFGTSVEPRSTEVWIPAMMQATVRYRGNVSNDDGDDRQPWIPQRELAWLDVFVRADAAAVPAVTEAINLTMQRDYAQRRGYRDDADARRRYQAIRHVLDPAGRGTSRIREQATAPLVMLLVMVALLLAITCANLAGLLLARAGSRHREMAVRLSMGAGRGRVLRQLLTESLLLSLTGGALGLVLAYWATSSIGALLGDGAGTLDLRPDLRVVAAAFAVSVMTGLLFGLVPAFRGTRVALSVALKAQARGTVGGHGGSARFPFGRLLIPAQLAFALLLLIVAALFGRSFLELSRVDVGLASDRLLMARIDASAGGYERPTLEGLHRQILDRVAAVPGVQAVSLSANGPFSNSRSQSRFEVEGYQSGRDERLIAQEEQVTPDYFRTIGVAVVRGRAFTAQDTSESRRLSIINETFANRYFKGRDPIGRRWGYSADFEKDGFEIVGVVRDARYNDLKGPGVVMAYYPAAQRADEYLSSLEIRTQGDPAALATAVRQALREVAPRLPIASIETMEARLDRSIGPERFLTWLTLGFGSVALFLACLGLYGTMSYAVTRRTPELGLRMALGASRGGVQWLILRDALRLVAIGLAVGLPLALLAASFLDRLLFGVAPMDVVSHGGAALVLLVVALLAAYLPAQRASRVDPMTALRTD